MFSYKITYAFIKFYPKDNKSKKVKSKKKILKNKSKNLKKEKEEVSSTNEKDAPKEKNSKKEETSKSNLPINSDLNALDTLNLALDIFKALKAKLGKFITSVKITNLYIDFHVADLDAFDCALKFGKLNAILGNILGFLYWNFKVKKKSINVQPKYNSNDSVYDISFKVKLGLGKGLGKILVMVFKVIPVLKKNDII